MSKSMEKEYKEYMLMETPDLWSRIEKELSKHENVARTEIIQEKTEKQPRIQSEVVNQEEQLKIQSGAVNQEEQSKIRQEIMKKGERSDIRNGNKKRNIRRWTTVGSLAAAALVVVVVFPFVNGSIKSTESLADMSAADTAGSTMMEDNIAEKEEFAVDMEADMASMEGNGASTITAEVTEMEAAEEMNEVQYAEEEAPATEQVKLKADVVIIEITEKENGIILYSGETESGEIYIFTIDENTIFTGIEEKREGLQEGNNYCIEVVAEEAGYLAVSVEKTQ
ncbi:MAG: hypothetical protein IJN54_09445 [Lachnospiraceae bacterium]|nr:hypothetical protein [Lachnospiraceae bacterium]